VVDTNILVTYITILERILELQRSRDMETLMESAGLPAFKIFIVVPYVVLGELDHLKNKKGGAKPTLSAACCHQQSGRVFLAYMLCLNVE
jgi:PIN domain